ncbi:aldo/keto reductase [Pseudomonas sp. EA_15y_Pfl2_R67]|uniref:aldo/keto reductase n=1 Tax=Pseudomonas sp. EA_15y_Pfl2_R67 TaxID=3088687 RepID=UPI0030DDDDA9
MILTLTGKLAGKTVRRLGFGTMRLTGPGIWGPPSDQRLAIDVLRKAVESGIQHIDTADAYGPDIAEPLIRAALSPYPDDLIIGTKGGFTRQGPGRWTPCGAPAYLRQCVEMSLRRLNVEALDLYYLHRIDPAIPLADQLGELERMREEGKIKALGMSKVDIAQLEEAISIAPIAAVQNPFNLHEPRSAEVVAWCEREDVAFVPYAPLGAGKCLEPSQPLSGRAVTPQAALKWLLEYSPIMFPIPGTSSIEHLMENLESDGYVKP